jgi:NUDIX domain
MTSRSPPAKRKRISDEERKERSIIAKRKHNQKVTDEERVEELAASRERMSRRRNDRTDEERVQDNEADRARMRRERNDRTELEQTVELRYHLIGLIRIISDSRSRNDANKYKYWLVGVYDVGTEIGKKWAIDIPGGKRHVGETTWECAEREMFEETSLPICSKWEIEEQRGNDRDSMNMYYFVRHH